MPSLESLRKTPSYSRGPRGRSTSLHLDGDCKKSKYHGPNTVDCLDFYNFSRGCGEVSFPDRRSTGSRDGSWPWVALLGTRATGRAFKAACGGSLVSSSHVVTAAHCFPGGRENPRIKLVRLGESVVGSRRDDPSK